MDRQVGRAAVPRGGQGGVGGQVGGELQGRARHQAGGGRGGAGRGQPLPGLPGATPAWTNESNMHATWTGCRAVCWSGSCGAGPAQPRCGAPLLTRCCYAAVRAYACTHTGSASLGSALRLQTPPGDPALLPLPALHCRARPGASPAAASATTGGGGRTTWATGWCRSSATATQARRRRPRRAHTSARVTLAALHAPARPRLKGGPRAAQTMPPSWPRGTNPSPCLGPRLALPPHPPPPPTPPTPSCPPQGSTGT